MMMIPCLALDCVGTFAHGREQGGVVVTALGPGIQATWKTGLRPEYRVTDRRKQL